MAPILIADDDPDSRAILARRLRRRGYEVIEVSDGQSTLEQIAARPIGVILLDSLMPTLTGLEVLTRLRSDPGTAHLPVIVVTGKAFQADVDAAMARGATGYLTKPVDFTLALALIEKALNEE